MKRLICMICIFVALFSLSCCSKNNTDFTNPVNLFYCNSHISYNSASGLFNSAKWEFSGWENNLRGFLNKYVSSTAPKNMVSPFPLGAWILELSQSDETVVLLLNTQFSKLAPHEFTLACACLSMTVFELNDAEVINFAVYGNNDNNSIITMTRENLCLMDISITN